MISEQLIREAKVISFDVWGTLIEPNPDFKIARNAFIAERFNIDDSHVEHVHNKTKELINELAIMKGRAPSCNETYQLYLILLGASTVNLTEVRSKFEELFWKYPPILNKYLSRNIQKLQSMGKMVGVASNSNFITGSIITKFLETGDININFSVFSDMTRYAKPNSVFFSTVHQHAHYMTPFVHIGNDPTFDIVQEHLGEIISIIVKNPSQLNEILEAI